jgi:uncharacterized protein
MRTLNLADGLDKPRAQTKRPVVWFEIPVTDLDRAKAFYGILFGWEFEPFVDYDENYLLIRGAEESVGGALVLEKRVSAQGAGPILFMSVEDLDESIEQARRIGGIVAQSTKRITDKAGWFAVIIDPDGNRVGLWSKSQHGRGP